MTSRLLHLLPDRTDLIEANIKLELLFLQTNHIWFNWKEERTSQNEWASVDLFLMVLMRAAAWPSLPWLTSHRGLSGMAGCSSRNTRCRDTENTPSRYQSPSSRAEKYYIEKKYLYRIKNITLKENIFVMKTIIHWRKNIYIVSSKPMNGRSTRAATQTTRPTI